jgi:hypothetical protein
MSLLRMCPVLIGVAAALGLASCGSSSANNSPNCSGSSFTATLKSGATTVATLGGTACWSLTGTSDWALGLTDDNALDRIVVGREFGGPPVPPNTYPLPVGGGNMDFGMRVQLYLNASARYVCSPMDGTGTISFTTAFAPPTVAGFVTAVPLLCATSGGQTTFLQLDVASFVAKEGHVELIPP